MYNSTTARVDKLMRLSVPDKTIEIDKYFESKIGIMFANDGIKERTQYLKILKEGLDELAEKTKSKRLRKIATTEEELEADKTSLEKYTKQYNDVAETAKKQLFERARGIAANAGGMKYFDLLMDYRNKKTQGDKLAMRYEDAYEIFKGLDSVLVTNLRGAWEIILEIDDSPF